LSKQKKPHKKTKNDFLAIYLEDEDEGKLGHDEDPVLGVDLVIRTRPSDSLQTKEVLYSPDYFLEVKREYRLSVIVTQGFFFWKRGGAEGINEANRAYWQGNWK
jgi:hypothetical protein